MAKIVGLPKLSPTMEEGTLAAWVKKEGEKVEIDDLLAEVETDKATMEFRSFDKGVLLKILAEEGETLAPDQPVAIIGEEGEDISALVEEARAGGAESGSAGAEGGSSADSASAEKPQGGPKKTATSAADAKIVGLPKLSPTMEEGTLAAWVKKEGEEVEIDDLLAEVETDKATMEFRSFDKGVLLKILAEEGAVLRPDQPVAIIGEKGADISALIEKAQRGASTDEKGESDERGEAPRRGADSTKRPRTEGKAGAGRGAGGRILASPLVRRLARERDVDLSQVDGSGPRGRIVKRDLEGLEAPSETARGAAAAPVTGAERLPPLVEKASSMRRTIARRLTESKQQVPHYYLTLDIDAHPLLAARKELNARLEGSGDKLSVNDLILKGCAAALREVPEVNRSWVDGEIHTHRVVDVSVAVAIPDGLITPVVRDADRKGLREISREVKTLAERAKEKKLQPEEFQGGTFSISNLGMYGIESFSAVINPPEGAILAIGTVRQEPVVRGGEVVPGQRMRMTLSCDHRVIDGAVGARFCKALKEILEAPLALLL